ncbi:unnamed protein product [Acanthoscelides obtectus]|uniref:HTH psq-type domain-containing protein n=1 Tax=Acanthoscelides obtectus TaxID=200917 RepID=A0A9P0K6H5_ACAOB|nr:unnamed protein product [Acanthoscelides obtectus]CAK1649388.1 hypothetical protein AOBTE_LOCUS16208 [Acanthoscelides obtectus]
MHNRRGNKEKRGEQAHRKHIMHLEREPPTLCIYSLIKTRLGEMKSGARCWSSASARKLAGLTSGPGIITTTGLLQKNHRVLKIYISEDITDITVSDMSMERFLKKNMSKVRNNLITKPEYCRWTSEDMDHAINAYKQNQCGFNECCRRYNIPKPTLRSHLRTLNKKANENVQSLGRHTTFSTEIEMELAKHILKLEERLFGVIIRDVRRFSFQVAVRNDIPHRFNINKEMAGKGWYYYFMDQHPELSLRQPEKISMDRATGFNQKNLHEFFDILEKCVDENGFTAQKIYNVDESGFSTVQRQKQKIIARRGKHQVGGTASGERGVNTIAVVCASTASQTVPPMIIF